MFNKIDEKKKIFDSKCPLNTNQVDNCMNKKLLSDSNIEQYDKNNTGISLLKICIDYENSNSSVNF